MTTTDINALLNSLQGPPGTQPVPPAAPTSPDSFSLISAASTGTSGGGSRVRVLLTDEQGSIQLCRHGVGNTGDRVCVAPRGENIETCGTSHRGDPVALEPKSFYILRQTSPSQQILLVPMLHASRLTSEFANDLLQELHDLSEWAQIFRIIRVTLTQTSGPVSRASHDEHQRFLSQPLRTPAGPRARSRLQFEVETVPEAEEDVEFVSAEETTLWDHIPQTPEVNLEGLSTEEERASSEDQLPEWLLRSLKRIQEALTEQGSNEVFMHREIVSRWLLLADDLKKLEAKSELLKELVGEPGGLPTSDLWDSVRHLYQSPAVDSPSGMTGSVSPSLAELSGRTAELARALPALQLRVGCLETSKAEIEHKNEALSLSQDILSVRVSELSSQLATALNIVQALRNQAPPATNVSFQTVDPTQTPNWRRELELKLDTMDADLNFLKTQADSNGSISSFSTLIPSFQSVEDVEAWLKKGFAKGGGDDQPYHEDRSVGEYLPEDDIPTFGPFSDFFVVMCTCEDLESRATKGETLKEMELIEKAGLNHPGESTVVYALKHPIPGFLGKGTSANRKFTALLAVRAAADWDTVFTKEMARGLKNIWKENQADVEAVIRGHIEDSLSRHGHQALAALAREMLSTSIKFTNELFDYLTETYRDLTERSGFLITDAWLLASEVVARICKALNSSRSEVRSISAKSSSVRTTARILYGMLKVHDVMAEYLKLEIKNHPSVSSEYVKFLASHASFKDVQVLKKRLETMEKEVKTSSSKG